MAEESMASSLQRPLMSDYTFENIYDLSPEQLQSLDDAEEAMLRADFGKAEEILLQMLTEEEDCIPALNNLAHLMGRHFSDFEKAVEIYDKVLELEADNAWARDARRRYLRYVDRD
jgi:tetratricopeptide (TPR) repeat protein